MAVTAKVKLQNKTNLGEGDDAPATLTFEPDYADGRNKEWASATPHLSLVMTVVGSVAKHFEPGRAYTLTFEPDEG